MNKETAALKTFQSSFFNQMGGEHQFRALLEHVPDVEYFAKDKEGRFVAASSRTLRRIGMEREEDLIGELDEAIHPPTIAHAIRRDDMEVMTTRHPLVNRIEALYGRSRNPEWFLTTKIPIVSPRGDVIGVMGFVRPYRPEFLGNAGDEHIQDVISYIRHHHHTRLPVATLASLARLSQRQLNRKFQAIFHMSVQEYIMRTRIQSAGDELVTTVKSIGEIALDNGFYDQSFFTRYFRRYTGETPLTYRRKRRLPSEVELDGRLP